MEAIDPGTVSASPGWISRLVEVLQPLSVRADRLGSMPIFAGLGRTELEFAAGTLRSRAALEVTTARAIVEALARVGRR